MNRGFTYLASLVLLLGGFGPAAWGQVNQILNPEFDNGMTNWNTYPYTPAGFTASAVTGAHLSGLNAALMDVTNASVASIGISQGGLKFERGKSYPVGVTAKADKDREMVILIQLYKPEGPNWIELLLKHVSLTTTPKTFLFQYTHQDDSMADHPNWSATIYLMLKGSYWPMTNDTIPSKVWVDRVHVGDQPPLVDSTVLSAYAPEPAEGAVIDAVAPTLQWKPGDFAASHNVYLGTDADAIHSDSVKPVATTQQKLLVTAAASYSAGLTPGSLYYWRVDEVNDANPQSPWKGEVWSFLVRPLTAWKPVPADGSKFVDPNQDLSWQGGTSVLFHTVYVGDNADQVSAATTGGWMAIDPQWALTPLQPGKTYYWRVDEFTMTGATNKGTVWSFTAAAPGGLKAEYFNNTDLSGAPVVTRTEPRIDFNWGNGTTPGLNSPDAKVNVNDFSARWTGELAVDRTDTYIFAITANNGFRLWIDGRLMIDYWDNGTTATSQSEPILLTAGQTYSLRMDYYEGADAASARLFWQSAVQNRVDARAREIVPSGALGMPYKAHSPAPANGEVDTLWSLDLTWVAGDLAKNHDLYFGTDAAAVASADTTTAGIYQKRLAVGVTSFALSDLEWGRTYYWRVDEIDPGSPASPWKGSVWSFTTADFTVVDDFESYTDDETTGGCIYQTWIDGVGNGLSGSMVGYANAPFAEQKIVHGGRQSMPLDYNNVNAPYYSEAERTWDSPQNWTVGGTDTLVLYVCGKPSNGREKLYVTLQDSTGKTASVGTTNTDVVVSVQWTALRIPLADFAGVNASRIKKMVIGLGDRAAPTKGSAGLIFIDDLRVAISK